MRYRMLLVLVLLALFALPTAAQDDDTWYWAWDVLEGQLIAYTPGGESNVLIESGFDSDTFNAWRVDEQTEFAVVSVDSTRQLYRLTSTEAQPTAFPEPDATMGDAFWTLFARNDDYLALAVGSSIPSGAALLVNIEANTAIPLEWKASFLSARAGFSADGAYFRYLGRNPEDDRDWTIREVKLETGAERVIYTFEDEFFPIVTTDTHGDQWIYGQRGLTTFIPAVGEPVTQTDEILQTRGYNGDGIFSYAPLCEADCVLDWQPSVGAPIQSFVLPSSDGNFPSIIRSISDSQLLIQLGDEFWLLDANGDNRMLGRYDPLYVAPPIHRLFSPDGRYLLAMTDLDEPAYHVVDVQTGEAVIESDPEREFHIFQAFYGEGGFILTEDLVHFQFYRYSDGQTFDLGEPGGVYFQALADGSLLFSQNNPEGELERGIYRYEPDTETYTLLVAEARPLPSN